MESWACWFQGGSTFGTVVVEVGLGWMMFLPRRLRILCFLIITPWQVGIILSANYTFLNYLVLALGFLLLDDQFLLAYFPRFLKKSYLATKEAKPLAAPVLEDKWRKALLAQGSAVKIAVTAVMLTWIFYATLVQMVWMGRPGPRLTTTVSALETFCVADRDGPFAVIPRGRYEIEFQGSDEGQKGLLLPFHFKPP